MTEQELTSVRDLITEIRSYEEVLKNLRRMIGAKIPKYDGMPKGTSVESAVEKIAIRITDLSKKIEELKQALTVEAAKLEKAIIAELKSIKLQTLLILRYVDGMTFNEISQVMGYSEKHIRRLHKATLKRLKK